MSYHRILRPLFSYETRLSFEVFSLGTSLVGRSTVSIINIGLKRSLEPCKKFLVGGWVGWLVGGGGVEFSLLFWSKALVLDLRPGPS